LESRKSQKTMFITIGEENLRSIEGNPWRKFMRYTTGMLRKEKYVCKYRGGLIWLKMYWWKGEMKFAVREIIGRDLET
jgi:hypothetical protein